MIDQEVIQEEAITIEDDFSSDYTKERDKPMPSRNHGAIQSRLAAQFVVHYLDKYEPLSEVKLKLPNVKPATPDICIYPKMDIDLLDDEVAMTSPPLTTIEILSPKQALDDLKDKIFNIYFPSGVKSAWIVVPTLRSVHIFSPDRTFKTFTSGKLNDPATGIELELDSFFP